MTEASLQPSLVKQAERFGDDVTKVVNGAFGIDPNVQVIESQGRLVIKMLPVPLKVKGEELATLTMSIRCGPDTADTYIAVEKSSYIVAARVTREPIIRFDYDRDAHSKPSSHVQIHAHRGELTALLSKAGHKTPHSIAALHIPTGGPRFRPSIEDIAEFLIADWGFDGATGWHDVIEKNRISYRRIQARSVVRDVPEDAAAVLTELGYKVTPPADGPAEDKLRALRQW